MKRNKLWFMAPDDGANGGGDEGQSQGEKAFNEEKVVGSEPASTNKEGEGAEKKTEQAPTQVIDASKFAEAIKDVFKKEEPEQKPLTQEEARKLLKVWEPDDEWHNRFDNLNTRKAAILEMRDGMLGQFDTLSQFRMRDLSDQLHGKFNPALEYVTRAEIKERDKDFSTAYPDLAKPELKPLVEAVREQFKKEKKTFTNEEESHKAVATAVEAVIKTVNPDFKLSAGSSPATTKSNGQPAGGIPVTTGGSGGGGGGKTVTAPKSRGMAVFEK